MAEGVCSKCGFKAPAGLLKCPFCKVYIRSPGSSSSTDLKIPILPPPPPPETPPNPEIVKAVQRELARELFEDSSYEWQALPEGAPPAGETPPATPPPDAAAANDARKDADQSPATP